MRMLFIYISLTILLLLPTVCFPAAAAADNLSAARFPFSLRHSPSPPDGPFAFSLHGAFDGMVVIQSSTDLLKWRQEQWLAVEGGAASFAAADSAAASRKFYRAVRAVRVAGTVREVGTGAPIPHASVILTFSRLTDPGADSVTDEIGGFELFAVPPTPKAIFQVTVSAPGYKPFLSGATAQDQEVTFPAFDAELTPADLPLNDHFHNRTAIGGINLTFSGTTINATKEYRDPTLGITSDASPDQGNTIWWTWTSPINGAVSVTANHSVAPGLIGVFQGESIHKLNPLWESVHGDDGFFVHAGQQYEIVFSSHHSGQVDLAIQEITPVPPSIRNFPWPPQLAVATFWVEAEGTRPFHYQWHKDNVAIPGETRARLNLDPLTFEHVGSYTVEVTNESGSILSDEALITADRNANDLLIGTWAMEHRMEPFVGDYIATFHENTFALTRGPDNTLVGEGTYTVIRIGAEYRLEMHYTYSSAEIYETYQLTPAASISAPIYFFGTITIDGQSIPAFGTFTRR